MSFSASPATRDVSGSGARRAVACVLHGVELLAAGAFLTLILLDANLPGLLAGGDTAAEETAAPVAASRPALRPASRPASRDTAPASLPAGASGVLGRPFLLDVRQDQITLAVLAERPIRPVFGYGTTVAISAPLPRSARCGPPRQIPGTRLWVAEARLTGLTADTIYSYRLREAGGSAVAMLRTAAPAGAWFRFIVCGDTDGAAASGLWRTVARTQPTPQFLLHVGAYAREDWLAEFFAPAAEVLRKIPLVPTVFDDASRQAFAPLAAKPYYDLPLGAGRLLCLDTRREADLAPGSTRFAWLAGQLARAKTGWTFVALRRSPYGLGDADEAVRRHLVPLFERHGVDAVFSGAAAGYERAEWGGVPYFAVSVASANAAAAGPVPGWHRVADLANQKLAPRPCFLQVDANNEHITFTAMDAETGRVIEQLKRLRREDGAARFEPAPRARQWLQSSDRTRRRWAAAWLMDHAAEADRPALRGLAADTDPYLRVMAVRALARCDGVRSAGTVLARLQDRDAACLPDALAFFADHAYRRFGELSGSIAEEILAAGPNGGRADPRDATRLMTALAGALARHPSERSAALLAMMWSHPDALPAVREQALRHWLTITDPKARRQSVLDLAADAGAVPALRALAVADLGQGGDGTCLHALIALSDRTDLPVRVASAVRSAIEGFQPATDALGLIRLLQLAEQHAGAVPAAVRGRILERLRSLPHSPLRSLRNGALDRLSIGQVGRYLALHRRLTDAARWIAVALAAWVIVSRVGGLLRPDRFRAVSAAAPVRSLNVLGAVICVTAGLTWWYAGSWAWAALWAPLAVSGLGLARRWLNRAWPVLDPEQLPERAARHDRVRCRFRCALTALAAAAMMGLALGIGY